MSRNSDSGTPDRPSALPTVGLDRAALERIIKRAAELQAGELDPADILTDQQVLALGKDVGIPEQHLRQALQEERTRSVVPAEQGLVASWMGPTRVSAQRTLRGEAGTLRQRLDQWMAEAELLGVKRRLPDQTVWEPKRGMVASIRRGLSFGGRPFILTRARDVTGQVIGLDQATSHVRLLADLSNTRNQRFGVAAGLVTMAGLAAGLGMVLNVALAVAMTPIPLALLVSLGVARARRLEVERVQVALEQVLDQLEHRDGRSLEPGPVATLGRIAEEIRKTVSGGH